MRGKTGKLAQAACATLSVTRARQQAQPLPHLANGPEASGIARSFQPSLRALLWAVLPATGWQSKGTLPHAAAIDTAPLSTPLAKPWPKLRTHPLIVTSQLNKRILPTPLTNGGSIGSHHCAGKPLIVP